MKVLGMSGAIKIISLGLVDDQQVLAEATIADIQAEKIMFYVQEAGIKPEQIEGVAVARGPGSYSGLRGSLAAAKTLAQTLAIPLIGVSTLEAVAYNLVAVEGTIAVLLKAFQAEVNFALFGAHQGKLKRLSKDLVLKEADLNQQLAKVSGKIWLVGDVIAGQYPDNFRVAAANQAQPYGLNVAWLGASALAAGKRDDPLTLTPHYSHTPRFATHPNLC